MIFFSSFIHGIIRGEGAENEISLFPPPRSFLLKQLQSITSIPTIN